MSKPIRPRERLKKEINIMLGGTLVDVELEDIELDLSIDIAIDRYRQRSGNSMEDSYIFMTFGTEQTFQLPQEVQVVKSVLRTGYGQYAGGASDPFSLAFANQMYSMNSPSGMGGGGQAGFLTLYDMSAQYQELAARLFGRDMDFIWNGTTKRITLARRPTNGEEVALEVLMIKPEDVIIEDIFCRGWIRSYAMAQAKMILGQGRGKFATFAGPQGGITMNGAELKQEAAAEIEKLDAELLNLIDANRGMPFIFG